MKCHTRGCHRAARPNSRFCDRCLEHEVEKLNDLLDQVDSSGHEIMGAQLHGDAQLEPRDYRGDWVPYPGPCSRGMHLVKDEPEVENQGETPAESKGIQGESVVLEPSMGLERTPRRSFTLRAKDVIRWDHSVPCNASPDGTPCLCRMNEFATWLLQFGFDTPVTLTAIADVTPDVTPQTPAL